MISDATFIGAIQVPPSGDPILLMADRQTTGGYPQIATVITADLPLAGQLAPGDWVEFQLCTRAEAIAALAAQEARLLCAPVSARSPRSPTSSWRRSPRSASAAPRAGSHAHAHVDDVAAAHRWAASGAVDCSCSAAAATWSSPTADSTASWRRSRCAASTSCAVATTRVRAGAGEPWDDVVAAAVSRGLAGLECLSGIPGSVGGTPVQNVGAYGQEVCEHHRDVSVFDRRTESRDHADDAGVRLRVPHEPVQARGRRTVRGVRGAFRLRPGPPTTTYPDVTQALRRQRASTPGLGDVRERSVLDVRRSKGW